MAITAIIELAEVQEMQADGSLHKFLSQMLARRVGGSEPGRFMMDLPIESEKIAGSKGEAVLFYQEEVSDYLEGEYDTGNLGEF